MINIKDALSPLEIWALVCGNCHDECLYFDQSKMRRDNIGIEHLFYPNGTRPEIFGTIRCLTCMNPLSALDFKGKDVRVPKKVLEAIKATRIKEKPVKTKEEQFQELESVSAVEYPPTLEQYTTVRTPNDNVTVDNGGWVSTEGWEPMEEDNDDNPPF